jgi:hypothetical protein
MRFLVLPMLALPAAPAVAADYLGEVLAVSDGDTFTMESETGNVRVRICGIDSPERGQPGYPWLKIECSRCKTWRDVDLAALRHPPTTFVHDLASRLRCSKCTKAGRRPPATLLQLAPRSHQAAPET